MDHDTTKNYEKQKSPKLVMYFTAFVFIAVFLSVMVLSKQRYEKAFHDNILQESIKLFELVKLEQFKASVLKYSQQNLSLSEDDILTIDFRWQQDIKSEVFTSKLLDNDLSALLKRFQKLNSEFAEIFVTDAKGLVIGMTNKTSDYYQADEAWWDKAYKKGSYFGEYEFDTSASKWGVPIYSLLKNEHGKKLGVVKALLDLEGLRRNVSDN